MKKIIFIIGVFFFLIACRKDIDKVDTNYEGDWYGTPDTSIHSAFSKHAELNIDSQSHMNYQGFNSNGESTNEFAGTAKVKGNTIHVSGVLFGHSFTIISSPTQINTTHYHWTMTLDGPDGTMPYYR